MFSSFPQPIPLSEVECWLRMNYVTSPDEKLVYTKLIEALDQHFLRYIKKQR